MPNITIHPPLAGIVRSRGFQKQPPYSCREAINYIPQYVVDGSETVAIRPALEAFDTPGTTVNLLAAVTGTTSETPQHTVVAGRNGTLYRWTGSAFTAVGGSGTVPSGRAAFAQGFLQKVYIPAVTPLVYDYATDTLGTWTASAGTVPSDARIIVSWRGGLWMAGIPDEPHVLYGSKTGDPLDWDFSGTSTASAWFSTGDDNGNISDAITALIPLPSGGMVVSTVDTMWLWTGHPRRGGEAILISASLGVRGQGAWCQGPDGAVYMLTNRGLATISAGGSIPALISAERIPNELIGLDYDYLDPRVCMEYDVRFNFVHITIRDTTNPSAWIYDLKNGGLWQQEYASYPHVLKRFDPIGTGRASDVLFGGAGYGGLARWDLDGTESLDRHRLVIGPMKLAQPMQRGMIREAQVLFGGGTSDGDAAIEIYCGPTGDSAYAAAVSGLAAAKFTTTVETLFTHQTRCRPLVAGNSFVFVIDQPEAVSNPQVVFEEVNLTVESAGVERGHVIHSDTTGPFAGSFTFGPFAGSSKFSPESTLITYWGLEEASGDRAASFSDSDLPLSTFTLSETDDTVESAAGKNGNGANLVEIFGSHLATGGVAESVLPIYANGITVSCWAKVTAVGDIGGDILLAVDDPDELLHLILITRSATNSPPAGDAFFGFKGESGADNLVSLPFEFTLVDGQFHFYMVWYDPDRQEIGVRVDEDEVVAAITSSVVPLTGARTVHVGPHTGAVIDELAIHNRVLPPDRRASIYNAGAGLFYPFS